MIIFGIACVFHSEEKVGYYYGYDYDPRTGTPIPHPVPYHYTDYPYRNYGIPLIYCGALFLILLLIIDRHVSKQIREQAL